MLLPGARLAGGPDVGAREDLQRFAAVRGLLV